MKLILSLILMVVIFNGCKREEFNTQINFSLDSGIPTLKTAPTAVLITKSFIDMNKVYRHVVKTIYTDSFGNLSTSVKLLKPKKKEFYKIEVEENLWIVPLWEPQEITAGFVNTIKYRVAPKWRKYVNLEDLSGKYLPKYMLAINNLSRDYAGISYPIDSFAQFSNSRYMITAPSDSYITVYLNLIDRATKKPDNRKYKFNANTSNNIWIRF